MAATIIGGSANITLDLAQNTSFELTGLDASGRVLQSVNVKIKDDGVATAVNITLPTIASLNNRNVTFNINSNDFGKDIQVLSGGTDRINGETGFTTAYPKYSVISLTSTSSDNWSLPVIQELP